jgi:hypothetical protein
MRCSLITSLLVLISSVPCLAEAPVTSTSAPYASIVGVWKANIDSLPMMTLTVEEDKGKLTGAVLFFLIRRESGSETSTATTPEPLIDPTFDGKTLRFQVSHSHAHPGSGNDKPVAFRFDISGDGKIRFKGRDGQEIELVRETPN